MSQDNKIFLYKKPDFLCRKAEGREAEYLQMSEEEFIENSLHDIDREINQHGLSFRRATKEDIYDLMDFIAVRYRADLKDEVSPYDIYRFIEYGHGIVVENGENKIRGCLFEVGYQTPDMVSYSVRLGISRKLKGKGLGRQITNYSCLLAMKRGSLVKKGLIDFDNHVNLYIQLNKNGWMAENFYPDIQGLGSCFTACLPLSKEGMLTNKIDNQKLVNFVKKGKNGIDYKLVDINDIETVTNLYQENNFKVIALVKEGLISNEKQFFLMKAKDLEYKPIVIKTKYEII